MYYRGISHESVKILIWKGGALRGWFSSLQVLIVARFRVAVGFVGVARIV